MKYFEKMRKFFVGSDTHDDKGNELGNPIPKEAPLGFKKPLTIQEQIQRALRSQQIIQAQAARGEETLEDSMDFGPEVDEPLPLSAHQIAHLVDEEVKEVIKAPKAAPQAATAAAPVVAATPPAGKS